MRKYFLKQLEKSKLITKENLSQLKGKPIYNDYRIGDKVLYFLNQEFMKARNPDEIDGIILKLELIVEGDLDLLKEDFKFIRVNNDIPVLERRSMDKT